MFPTGSDNVWEVKYFSGVWIILKHGDNLRDRFVYRTDTLLIPLMVFDIDNLSYI